MKLLFVPLIMRQGSNTGKTQHQEKDHKETTNKQQGSGEHHYH